jgi:hypothetical protein
VANEPIVGRRLEIKVLGAWSARRAGKETITGENLQRVLHALILGGGRLDRMQLRGLHPDAWRKADEGDQALRDALKHLRGRHKLNITGVRYPTLEKEQQSASIDLFEFFFFAESGEYGKAWRMIERGQEPVTPLGPDAFWNETLQRFQRCRVEVERECTEETARGAVMRSVREELLGRTLVAGVGPETPIGELREELDSLTFAWRSERPAISEEGPLPKYLRDTLVDGGSAPRRIVVVGAPGSGKALTAISTFLRLTDILESPREPGELRTVLFVDARQEGTETGFAGEEWLGKRLAASGHEAGDGRPIAIVPHADAFLARSGRPTREALQLPLFAKTDVMLCCNELHYEQVLRFAGYGSHVVRLLPWRRDQQRTFALALYDDKTMLDAFEQWRGADEARDVLCRVPLNLTYVLWLLDLARQGSGHHGIHQISARAQLLESVARMRIQTQGADGSELDAVMDELGEVAHRFNRASSPADVAISFPSQALREHLKAGRRQNAGARYDTLTRKTLLGATAQGKRELRFEDALWGWFFTAYHLVRSVQSPGKPSAVLKAFGRLYWPNVIELCEELLRDRLQLHEEAIVTALRDALEAPPAPGIVAARRRIAREQIAYLLGVLANPGLREQLAQYFDAESSAYEEDRLVRRALVFGIANGGSNEFADRYAEELRAERKQPPPKPLADTNVGFLLGYRGDQAFDLEDPDRIELGVEPKRLVVELAKSLLDKRHRGSWRLKLATLIDLGDPERIEPERFAKAVAPHREELLGVLEHLDSRKVEGRWPEVGALREILKAIAPSSL